MNTTIRHSGLAKVRTAVAAVGGAVCLFALTLDVARAWQIDFEGLGSGVTVDSQYGAPSTLPGTGFGTSALFSGRDQTGVASSVETLDTNNQPNKSDFKGPFAKSDDDTNMLDPGHVLVLAGQGAGSIVIDFSRATVVSGMTFFDIDAKEVRTLDSTNEIEYFDVNGNQILDNAFYTPMTGNKRWESYYAPIYNVKKLVINLAGSGAIDKVKGWEIPEPGQTGLLVFGIALAGWC